MAFFSSSVLEPTTVRSPLPVWTCHECGERTVVGSRTELEKIAIRHPRKYELHRNGVDQIETRCRCGGGGRREAECLLGWRYSWGSSWGAPKNPPQSEERRG